MSLKTHDYIELLRQLCRGTGIRANLELITPEVLSEFGCDNGFEFADLIGTTLQDLINQAPANRKGRVHLFAAQTALGLDDGEEANLTKRREDAVFVLGISPRTIMRYETQGIELVLAELGFANDVEPEEGLYTTAIQRLKRVELLLEALAEHHGVNISM